MQKRYFILIVSLVMSLALIAFVVLSSPGPAQSPEMQNKNVAVAINEVLEKTFKPNEPGAAVIVVKDGKVVLRKGYGLANVELGVPIEPDMVFRIGSVTKQFTAVSILMLMEQGKLSLTDEITRFLPDYPTQGHKITIEHLLIHTSGIKSYTSLPEWRPQWRKDVTLKEMIDVFKDKPMEFTPGERWNYNNSAYVLLGAIIEKSSGQSYADFVEKNIFAPLGMKRSFYDNTSRIIPRRASGYTKGKDGYLNCDYLSMTWPHAAGALVSTVDDLALWDAALYTGKVVKQDSLKRAWAPYPIKDGRSTKYGYGWAISSVEGHRSIEHGGGINGFTCTSVRLPDDRVYVAVLTNRDSGTENLGHKLAALAVGKKIIEPVAVKLPAETFDKYIGVYDLDEKRSYIFTREGDNFFFEQPVFGKQQIEPLSETEYMLKINRRVRLIFAKDAAGKITGVELRAPIDPDEFAKRTDKPLPKP
ncbi:MAG: beta-lactamase family protein [Acidobacteria bacterium]|nr:beta-lactamase family protein [Acidobacteriota bacterium]